MKIAILHYWFLTPGGGEKVTESLAELFPEADIFCLFADWSRLPHGIAETRVHASFLNKIPFAHRLNRALFPFFAAAAGSFDLSNYDLILSSDSPPAKGIVTSSEAVHLSYCHTPGRYIWDQAASFTARLPWFSRPVFAEMASNARTSDYVAAQRVDHFIANSNYTARRIRKYYGRNSTVIYPPVDTARGTISEHHDDYYLSVGRLIKPKRVDLLIHACNKLKRRLVIVGEGRDEKALKAIAGPTIEFVGRVSSEETAKLYARCRAFLFAADEDFGIVAIEAQSFGRPVVAYGFGGSLETVRVNDRQGRPDTGIFFYEQSPKSLEEAILRFEGRENEFDPSTIREHALTFDAAVFQSKVADFVSRAMAARDMTFERGNLSREVAATMSWDGITERRRPQPSSHRRTVEATPPKMSEPISVGHRKTRSAVYSKDGH